MVSTLAMHFKKVYNSAEVARGPGDALYCGMVYCMLLLGWCKLLPDGSRLEELCLFTEKGDPTPEYKQIYHL